MIASDSDNINIEKIKELLPNEMEVQKERDYIGGQTAVDTVAIKYMCEKLIKEGEKTKHEFRSRECVEILQLTSCCLDLLKIIQDSEKRNEFNCLTANERISNLTAELLKEKTKHKFISETEAEKIFLDNERQELIEGIEKLQKELADKSQVYHDEIAKRDKLLAEYNKELFDVKITKVAILSALKIQVNNLNDLIKKNDTIK